MLLVWRSSPPSKVSSWEMSVRPDGEVNNAAENILFFHLVPLNNRLQSAFTKFPSITRLEKCVLSTETL